MIYLTSVKKYRRETTTKKSFKWNVYKLSQYHYILQSVVYSDWWRTRQCIISLWLSDTIWRHTVYPKKCAHGFCFAVHCCGYILTDFPISIRLTSMALWQSNDCPSASKATLMNMDKYFMWIHYERLHNHNKAKHNKTVCIFLGIYCIPGSSLMSAIEFLTVYQDRRHSCPIQWLFVPWLFLMGNHNVMLLLPYISNIGRCV